MKSLKLIITLFIVIISINSSFAQFGNLKDKLGKLTQKSEPKNSGSGKYNSQGITSSVHKNNIGKIIFSSEEINFQNENESQFKSSFSFGQDICYRVYTDDCIYNKLYTQAKSKGVIEREFEEYATYKTVFFLDGKEIHTSVRDHKGMSEEAKSTWTTFKGEYYLNINGENSSGMQDFIDFTSKIEASITPGQHDVKVVIYPYMYVIGVDENIEISIKEPIAEGGFKLNVGSPMVKANDPILCKTPRRGMNEIDIENKVIGTAKSVTIISNSWTIERNEFTGIPLRREVYAQAAMINDEGTCGYQEFTIVQEYDGAIYGNPGIGEYTVFIPVPCSCLK